MARLLVLWLLAERPMHGYQIKRALTDAGMAFWFGLEDGSIYSVLRTLAKHGHATAEEPKQVAGRPARTRYTITPAGRALYRDLLREAWRSVTPAVGPLAVALAAEADLPRPELSGLVASRVSALRELTAQIDRHASAAPDPQIPRRARQLAAAELAWLQDFQHQHTDPPEPRDQRSRP